MSAIGYVDSRYDDVRTTYFRIIGDGVVLYENTSLEEGTKPMEISLDIAGVEDLTLELGELKISLQMDVVPVLFANATLWK